MKKNTRKRIAFVIESAIYTVIFLAFAALMLSIGGMIEEWRITAESISIALACTAILYFTKGFYTVTNK